MNQTTLAVLKKECIRIFSDRKLFFTAVLMPGILLFVMYSLMGNFLGDMFAVDEDYIYQVHAINLPESAAELLSPPGLRIEILNTAESSQDMIIQQILNRETDLLLVFPPDFDALVANFNPATATEPAPNILMWSNSARSESMEARNLVTGLLNSYHHALTHRFSINAPSADVPDGNFDLATDADIFAMVIGFMIPMLFIMFMYTGCQALAPESIAGEKERGTLGALLVTPARRRDMALGKILGIAIFGLLSAIGSIVGTILSIPSITGMEGHSIFDFYSIGDFALLFLVAASTTLVFVAVLSVMSAYAKSVKEANAYASPLMLVSIICGLASTVLGGVPSEVFF